MPSYPSDYDIGVFQVDFENLIKVLGQNLYANPKVAVRELIQNASDSCVRRQEVESFRPAIQVIAHAEERILIFEDNGSGMSRDEVVQDLASIGGGRTRRVRQWLETSNPAVARMLIGQFGIGFLSAFVIADKVEVDTLSIEGGLPVRWVCESTVRYQIGTGDRNEPGTRITLYLKPAHYDLLEEDILRETIVRYADFITFPIYLNGSPQPVNRMQAPWHREATEVEYAEYIQHRYGIRPLALEPISRESADLSVQGVLFIPPRSAEWMRRLRAIDLFQKRIYVGEDLNLLPEWAGFVSGMMDCATVELTADRTKAVVNDSYWALQSFLETAVTAFVRRLAENDRPTFLEVIRQHDWPVKWGAVRNDFFFDQVRDLIPFKTDMGPMVLSAYLQRVPERLGGMKTIYYIPGEQPLGQQQSVIFRARGVPVIQADLVEEQFLRKYAERVENVGVQQMASGVVGLMTPAEGLRWRALEARYNDLGIVARAFSFYPPEMPAMVVRQADYDVKRLIEQIMEGNRSLLDFITRIGRERSDAYGLCFNVDNPLIQRLAEYQGDETVLNAALRAIYSSALLAAGVELTTELSQSVARAQMRVIELLLEQEERLRAEGRAAPYTPSSFDEPVKRKEEPATSEVPEWASLLELLDEQEEENAEPPAPDRGPQRESFIQRLIRRFRK
ncbi:MAG: ATP-binding protein [candidate division WOR-3 bacterium]